METTAKPNDCAMKDLLKGVRSSIQKGLWPVTSLMLLGFLAVPRARADDPGWSGPQMTIAEPADDAASDAANQDRDTPADCKSRAEGPAEERATKPVPATSLRELLVLLGIAAFVLRFRKVKM